MQPHFQQNWLFDGIKESLWKLVLDVRHFLLNVLGNGQHKRFEKFRGFLTRFQLLWLLDWLTKKSNPVTSGWHFLAGLSIEFNTWAENWMNLHHNGLKSGEIGVRFVFHNELYVDHCPSGCLITRGRNCSTMGICFYTFFLYQSPGLDKDGFLPSKILPHISRKGLRW